MGDQAAMPVAPPAQGDVAMTEAAPLVLEIAKDVAVAHEAIGYGNGNAAPHSGGQIQPSVEEVIVDDLIVEDMIVPTNEEERLWGLVRDNAADFNAWTELIQETEKSESIVKIEKAYDAFLGEFPLCYGYWKKYADHEAKLGTPEKIVDVYERAVKAVAYSVDIWMHYSAFAMEKFDNPEMIRRYRAMTEILRLNAAVEDYGSSLRAKRGTLIAATWSDVVWFGRKVLSCCVVSMAGRILERGVSLVGTDYLSHLLWDKFIEFEYSQLEWSRLAQIYTRILQIPLQHLDRYNTSFKQIAHSRPLSDLRAPEETAAAVAAGEKPAELQGDVPLPDADVSAPSEAPDGAADTDKGVESGDSKELEEYLAVRETYYRAAKEWDSKIRDFEIAIRRPYFHVKPLDEAQLANWHRYLDFIEKEGGFEKTVKLYERCLIACANYSDYWIRFVQRMDVEGKVELALNGLQRATGTFVKRRPDIHLFAARFREQHSDVDGARASYETLRNELVPGLLEVFVKQANFEHRQGNSEAACAVFDAALQSEKLKEDSRALAVVYIQYSRFLDQVLKSVDKAREVFTTALDHLPTSKVLWEAAIYFEATHIGPNHVQRVDALVEQASTPLRPDGSPGLLFAEREEISCVHLEFVDLLGDFEAIRKAEARHRQLFPSRKSTLDSKKRPSAEVPGQDRAKVLKPYVVTTVAPAPVISNGQVAWTAAYAPAAGYVQSQPQAWQPAAAQPTPQVQPQQWTQSYATYGGYTTYAPQPQATVTQPQTVYTGYAQPYAPQEVIQTYTAVPAASYVQETVYRAPVPSPTAQPAGATVYYGSYY